MGPRYSSAETQVCHRSYIIAATIDHADGRFIATVQTWIQVQLCLNRINHMGISNYHDYIYILGST
jgi:hypothetical protein